MHPRVDEFSGKDIVLDKVLMLTLNSAFSRLRFLNDGLTGTHHTPAWGFLIVSSYTDL